MQGGVKIGTTYDMEQWGGGAAWEGTAALPGVGIAHDQIRCGDNEYPCVKGEGWVYFEPTTGVSNILEHATTIIEGYTHDQTVEIDGHDPGTSKHCRHPINEETRSGLYYRTWSRGGTPGDWLPVNGDDVEVEDEIQFAVKLTSNHCHYTAMLIEATQQIQYEARTESDYGVACPDTGVTITYDRPFVTEPSISIMSEDLRSGDYYKVEKLPGAEKLSFNVQFFNSTGAAKAVDFDWIADGYGSVN
jgi:hypothetical protein